MKATIKRNNNYIREKCFAIAFITPYFEPFIHKSWRIGNEAVGRSIIFIELAIIVAHILHIMVKGGRIKISHVGEYIFCFYAFLMLIVNTAIHIDNVMVAAWIVTPLLCALSIDSELRKNRVVYEKVIYYGIIYFTIYAALLLTYNIIQLDLFNTGNRLKAIAGGPVVFGYTLAVYFSIVITNKKLFTGAQITTLKLFYTFLAIITGSRGSVWPIVFLWIFDLVYGRLSYKHLAAVVSVPIAIIIVNPLSIVSRIMPRLLVLTDSSRLGSALGAMEAFFSLDWLYIIVGKGQGNWFPYQAWVNRNIATGLPAENSNFFSVNGIRMLVQPHNSFIYFLLELGILGFLIIICILIKNTRLLTKEMRVNRMVLIGTIVLVNLLDSIFIVEPGVSFVMWLVIFYSSNCMIGSVNELRKEL